MPDGRCPCGTLLAYADCCGPLHRSMATLRVAPRPGTVPRPSGAPRSLRSSGTLRAPLLAGTAEQLMRSRYSAFAVGDAGYLLATWHPRTRPRRLRLDPAVRWTGLEVLATAGGGLLATEGTVEFRAHSTAGSQHERSRFVREDGRWFYLDGVPLP